MNEQLLNDPQFARFYRQWQAQPESTAFVAVADLLRLHGEYDEAISVCRAGLRHGPKLVAARVVLAQCLEALQRREDAHAVLLGVLADAPNNAHARGMIAAWFPADAAPAPVIIPNHHLNRHLHLGPNPNPDPDPDLNRHLHPDHDLDHEKKSDDDYEADNDDSANDPPVLATMTMAKLYIAQGHHRDAARVYRAILAREPDNEAARAALSQLGPSDGSAPHGA